MGYRGEGRLVTKISSPHCAVGLGEGHSVLGFALGPHLAGANWSTPTNRLRPVAAAWPLQRPRAASPWPLLELQRHGPKVPGAEFGAPCREDCGAKQPRSSPR